MSAFQTGAEVVWPNHGGARVDPEALYFGNPGDAIGRVLSASTDDSTRPGAGRTFGRVMLKLFAGLLLGGVGAGVGAASAWLVGELLPAAVDLTTHAVVGYGLVAFMIGVVIARQKTRTTFVGTDGVSRSLRARNGVETETLRWEDAAHLKFQQTRNYTNGVYTGTVYDFTWRGPDGKKRFRISGGFRQKEVEAAPPGNEIHFAHAAEASWTAWRLGHLAEQLEQRGAIEFAVGRKNRIALSDGAMELRWGDKVERLTPEDIDSVTIDTGFMTIKRVGARAGLFSSDGVFRFNVNGMEDFRVFLAALNGLMGIRF